MSLRGSRLNVPKFVSQTSNRIFLKNCWNWSTQTSTSSYEPHSTWLHSIMSAAFSPVLHSVNFLWSCLQTPRKMIRSATLQSRYNTCCIQHAAKNFAPANPMWLIDLLEKNKSGLNWQTTLSLLHNFLILQVAFNKVNSFNCRTIQNNKLSWISSEQALTAQTCFFFFLALKVTLPLGASTCFDQVPLQGLRRLKPLLPWNTCCDVHWWSSSHLPYIKNVHHQSGAHTMSAAWGRAAVNHMTSNDAPYWTRESNTSAAHHFRQNFQNWS